METGNRKNPPRILKAFRLIPGVVVMLRKLVQGTGWTEAHIAEMAISEYYINHPEFWSKEVKE